MSAGDKIVLLGASGFIGRAVAARLAEADRTPVEAYDSSELDLSSFAAPDRLCGILNERTVLLVCVQAGSSLDPFQTFSREMAIAANLARALRRSRILRVVYLSSVSVYGDARSNPAITERTPIDPTDLYGIRKWTAEAVLAQSARQRGTPLAVLRPCRVYGPGDCSTSYGPARFIRSILKEGCVRLFGEGKEKRAYLYIDDMARIVAGFAGMETSGVYNVGPGRSHSFQELVSLLKEISGLDFKVESVERDRSAADQVLDPAKLLAAFPHFRFTDLKEGIGAAFRACAAPAQGRRLNG